MSKRVTLILSKDEIAMAERVWRKRNAEQTFGDFLAVIASAALVRRLLELDGDQHREEAPVISAGDQGLGAVD